MADKFDFSSTMSLFFNEPTAAKCVDCGTTENLYILYTTEAGNSVRICEACRTRRAQESEEKEAAELARIRTYEAADEYEEPS